jgi:hypothetical protein
MSRVVSSRPRSSSRFLPHVVRGGKPAPFPGFISPNPPPTASMLQQTRTIPVIFVIVADPVGSGFVESLARRWLHRLTEPTAPAPVPRHKAGPDRHPSTASPITKRTIPTTAAMMGAGDREQRHATRPGHETHVKANARKVVSQFEIRRRLVSRCALYSYMARVEHGANSAWPFGPERFTTVPTGIGGCSPAILVPVGCSSGTSPIFPQVDRSPTLRSEPFSSRLATAQRSKNCCA